MFNSVKEAHVIIENYIKQNQTPKSEKDPDVKYCEMKPRSRQGRKSNSRMYLLLAIVFIAVAILSFVMLYFIQSVLIGF